MEASVIHAPAGPRRSAAGGVLLRLRTDDQLVALFRMGYEEAFGAIHDRYRTRLLAYTRQMLSRSGGDAEDVLQDVFLRAYSALRQDDRPVTLRAWLYRVAHNRCIDHLRRPEPPLGELYEIQRRPLQDPPAETERRERLRRLVDDVQRLPEQQRSALLMRELEGLAYTELADALDVSVPAVKSLLVRARCGLVEADEARDAACLDIRTDLDASLGRGVRASARSRRHLRDCEPCRTYRAHARSTRQGLRALVPAGGPVGALAKLLGLGGAGSAAGAGAGGGSAAVVTTGAAATATKVVAVVCCAAVVGGGAAELRHTPPARPPAAHRVPAKAPTVVAQHAQAQTVAPARVAADPTVTREPAMPPRRPVHEQAAATPATTPAAGEPDIAPIRMTVPVEDTTTTTTPAPTPQQASDQATATATGGALAPEEDPAPSGPATSSPSGTSIAATSTAPAG